MYSPTVYTLASARGVIVNYILSLLRVLTLGSTSTGPLWCEYCASFVLHWQTSVIFTTFIISVLSEHFSFAVLEVMITDEQTEQGKEPPSSPLQGDLLHFPKQKQQFSWKILCEIKKNTVLNVQNKTFINRNIYKTFMQYKN